MSDNKISPEGVELLELAVRHVRTPEGAQFYNLPIGSPITAAVRAAIEAKKGKAPAGSLTSGSKNHGAAVPKAKLTPGTNTGGALPNSKLRPIGGGDTSKPFTPKLKAKSDLTGNNHFSVGNSSYSAPSGSKLVTAQGGRMAYVLTADGKVHAFNENGEIDMPETLQPIMVKKLSGDLTNDPNYKEAQFDSTGTSFDPTSLSVGTILNDKDGNPAFKKIGDSTWQSTTLGAKLQDSDIKPLVESGDLTADTASAPDVKGADDAFNQTDKANFASMTSDEFETTLGNMPSGQKLSMKASGDGKPNTTTFTKQDDGTWKTNFGDATIAPKNIYHFKGQLQIGEDKQDKPTSPLDTEVGPQKPTAAWIGKTGLGSQVTVENASGKKIVWNKTGPDTWSQPGDHTGSATISNSLMSDAAEAAENNPKGLGGITITKSVGPKSGEESAPEATTPEVKAPTLRPKVYAAPKPGSRNYTDKATPENIESAKDGDKVLASFDALSGPEAENVEYVKDGTQWVNPIDKSDTIGAVAMKAAVTNNGDDADEQIFWHTNNTEPGQVARKGEKFGPGYKMSGEDFRAAPVGTKLTDDNGNTYVKVNDPESMGTFWEKDFGGAYTLSVHDELMVANSSTANFTVVGEASPEERPVPNPAAVEGKATLWNPGMPPLDFGDNAVYPGDYDWAHDTHTDDIIDAKPGDQIMKAVAFDYDEEGDTPHYDAEDVLEKQDDGSWKSLAYPQSHGYSDNTSLLNDFEGTQFEYGQESFYTNKNNSTQQPKEVVGDVEVAEPGKGHFSSPANVSDLDNAEEGDVLMGDTGGNAVSLTFNGKEWISSKYPDLPLSTSHMKQALNSNGTKFYSSDTNKGFNPETHRPGNYQKIDIDNTNLDDYPDGTKLTVSKVAKSGSGVGTSSYTYTKNGLGWDKEGSDVSLTSAGIKNIIISAPANEQKQYTVTVDQSSMTTPARPSNHVEPVPDGVPAHAKKVQEGSDVIAKAQIGDAAYLYTGGTTPYEMIKTSNGWEATSTGINFTDEQVLGSAVYADEYHGLYYAKNTTRAVAPDVAVGKIVSHQEFFASKPGTVGYFVNYDGNNSAGTYTVLPGGKILAESGNTYSPDSFYDGDKFEIASVPEDAPTDIQALEPGNSFFPTADELVNLPTGTVIKYTDGGTTDYEKQDDGFWHNKNYPSQKYSPSQISTGTDAVTIVSKPPVFTKADNTPGTFLAPSDLAQLDIGTVIANFTGYTYTKSGDGWTSKNNNHFTDEQMSSLAGFGDLKIDSVPDKQPVEPFGVGATFAGAADANVPIGTKFHSITANGEPKHLGNYTKIAGGQFKNTDTGAVHESLITNYLYTVDTAGDGTSPVPPLADWELELLSPLDNNQAATPGFADLDSTSVSHADIKEAIQGLESHSGFQVKYGLKNVADDSPFSDEQFVESVKKEAADAFPGDKPKPAFVKYLKSKLGVGSIGDKNDPITTAKDIHFGSATPKSTIQGFDGGDFSASEISDALIILQNYDGKLFKSELNKKGNALGSLDPIKIVGFDKDKLVTKKKFIDLLHEKLDNHVAANPTPEVPAKPGFPEVTSFKMLDDLEPGSIIVFEFGPAFVKNQNGTWASPTTPDVEVGSFAAGIDAGTIHVQYSADALSDLNAAMEEMQDENNEPELETPAIVTKSVGASITGGTSAFHDMQIGTTVSGTADEVPGLISYFTKTDIDAWVKDNNDTIHYSDSDLGSDKYMKFETYSSINNLPTGAQTPEAVQAANNDPTTSQALTEQEVQAMPTGGVLVSKDGTTFFTKNGDGHWDAISKDTGTHLFTYANKPMGNSADQGNVLKVISADPEFNQANLLPGKYSNGNKAYMIVNADGTGTYVNTKGEGKNLTAAAVKKNHDAGMKLYGGVVEAPSTTVPKTPAKPKVAPKTYEDIPDGVYFGGLPNNPKSITYAVKDGKVTAKKPLGSSPETGSGYYAEKNKIGQNASSAWMKVAATGAQIKDKYSKKLVAYKGPGGWHDSNTDENMEIPGWTSYSWVIGGHGYADEPVAFPKSKLQTMFEQGSLLDEYGNSIVPEGYSGGLVYFGAPTTVPDLLAVKKEIEDNPDGASSTLLKKHGINYDAGLTNKYMKQFHHDEVKTQQENTKDFMESTINKAVEGVDVSQPEGDAKGLFEYDALGNPIFPSNLVTKGTYSAADKTAYIKEAQSEFGGIIGQHMNKMTADEKAYWISSFKSGDFAKMYKYEVAAAAKEGKPHATGFQHPGYEGNADTNKVSWGAAVKGEIPGGKEVEGDWSPNHVQASLAEIDNYMIKAQMQNPTYLTTAEKRNWVSYHKKGMKDSVDQLSVTAKQRKEAGGSPLSEPLSWTDDVKPAKTYDSLFDDTEFPTSGWGSQAANDYHEDHLDDKELQVEWDKANNEWGSYSGAAHAVMNYFSNKKAIDDQQKLIPVYTLDSSKKINKSTHPVFPYTDQFGKHYWFKPAYENKLGKYRTEAEHLGNQFGKAFGFGTAHSELIDVNGKYGQMQQDVGGVGDLMNFDYSTLTAQQIADIGNEHMLDWFLDNDDTKGDNAKILSNGHIVGIDKGRAFKHFGAWNGLSADGQMNSNADTIYSHLYDTIRNGGLSKADIDKAYLAIQVKARRMAKVKDEKITEMLKDGMKNRDDYDNAYKINGKKVSNDFEGLNAAVLDRKNKLPEDIESMWKKIYKDAGFGDLPEIPEASLGDVISGLDHSKLHEEVFQANASGKTAMLSGAHIIGGTALVWTEQTSGKETNVKGELFLGPKKQKELLNYFISNASDESGASPASVMNNFGVYDQYGEGLIQMSKTVNHHSSDGAYNPDKTNQYESIKKNILSDVGEWSHTLSSNTTLPNGDDAYKFKSGQVIPTQYLDQYKLMLNHYEPQIEKVEAAIAAQGKVDHLDKFTPLTIAGKNKKFTNSDGSALTELANGKYIYTNSDGEVFTVSKDDPEVAHAIAGEEGWDKIEISEPETPVSNIIITKNAQTHEQEAKFDPETNVKTLKGGNVGSGTSGQEYQVTLATGEIIYWRNSGQTNTAKGQQGKLSFVIPNTEDPSAVAESMQRIQEQLDNMGISTNAADPTSAELTYWREMYGILENRSHKGVNGKKYAGAYEKMKVKIKALGGDENEFLENLSDSMSPEEETEYWRDLYSEFWPDQVVQMLENEGYLPQFDHQNLQNSELETGRPFWQRFDISDKELYDADFVLSHSTGNDDTLAKALESGALLGGEERLRQLGSIYTGGGYGMSSALHDQQNGSSHQIYTRITSPYEAAHSGYNVIMSPKAILRTRTYSLGSDNYGNLLARKDGSPSNPLDAVKKFKDNGGNETMLPNMSSLLDQIEVVGFENASKRNELIQKLKKLGYEKIRGVPIEDRIVMRNNMEDAINKIRTVWAKEIADS